MTWASIALALLKIVSMVMEYVNNQKQYDAGYDKAVADAAQSILTKTKAGKALMEKVNAMSETEVDKELRDLEPAATRGT